MFWGFKKRDAPPPFAIVIPSFRCPVKLERSIESVLREPRELFELLVVDGGSDDATLVVLKKHEPHLRWISESDDGVYDALNKGIARTTGRYLYFLGAGDTLRAGILQKIAARLPHFRIGFVYGNVLMHDKGVVWDGPWTPEKFRTRTPCQQAIFYDRRIFPRQGLFDLRFKTLADYALNIRCFGDKKIAKIFVDEIIADYEGGGFSANFRDEAFYAERDALLKEHLGIEPKKKRAK